MLSCLAVALEISNLTNRPNQCCVDVEVEDLGTPDEFIVVEDQFWPGLLPSLGVDLIETVTCRYTMTPDEDFVVDRHPADPRIVIGSPCSGHGFKFAVVVGRILADLAVAGATTYDIARFRLDRPALAVGPAD